MLIAALSAAGLAALAYVTKADKLILLFAAFFAIGLVLFVAHRPEYAVYVFVFVLYTNLAVIAKKLYGVPDFIAATFIMLLIFPLFEYVFRRRQRLMLDPVFGLMVVFMVTMLASSLVAINKKLAISWIIEFCIEGMLLYFLLINAIRTRKVLERALWVWLIAASLLGSLSLVQEMTGTRNTFLGLAQRFEGEDESDEQQEAGLLKAREKVRTSDRAGGPVNAPNRYAQIMLMVLPLAVFRFWRAENRRIKIYAVITSFLILSGVLLSYSRGGFLTLSVLIFLLVVLRYVKISQIVKTLVVVVLIIPFAAPGYFARLETIKGIEALFNPEAEVKADGPTRGRLTEMLAALMCFLDHPILGVGPGQYTPYYSMEYQTNSDFMFRYIDKARRAHILYFELMAETGILGFMAFMAIIFYMLQKLWAIRTFARRRRPDITNLATAFCFCILAYLGTSVFLHIAYQRYLWFLLGMASAAARVFEQELREKNAPAWQPKPQSEANAGMFV